MKRKERPGILNFNKDFLFHITYITLIIKAMQLNVNNKMVLFLI